MTDTITTLWAIRQRGTMRFLPATATGRGTTHTEPCCDGTPKLFGTERGAKIALRAWRKGAQSRGQVYGFYDDLYDDLYDDVGGSLLTVPQPHRDEMEMDVVPVLLVLA